jgi:hypothetical protein
MNAPAPPKKAPGELASKTGRKLIASREYHAFDLVQASSVWAAEGIRLLSAFARTHSVRHLTAAQRHITAMCAQLERSAA